MYDNCAQQAATFYLGMLKVFIHPMVLRQCQKDAIADASTLITNFWVKFNNERTGAKVNLLHNKSNPAY